MPDPRDRRLHTLIGELKRRRIFRVAVGYAAVAFATVSIASDFLPALRLPDWTVTFVAFVMVLGFPVAMLLAWVYDITPAGVRRTPAAGVEAADMRDAALDSAAETLHDTGVGSAARFPEPRTAGFVGIGIVIALVSVGALAQFGGLPVVSASSALPSIAVLPFENVPDDPSTQYFSAGIHEEVLTQLYKLGGMTVIARTSVMQYRGTTKSIREVAAELGVGAVLEASVRRAGDRVRIDARLIDPATSTQIWAESYDRELSDVLAIQAELAQRIGEALHARISPAARTQLARLRDRTVDPAMYELYLRGLYELGEGRHHEAIRTLRAALGIDPDYAPAHAAIARSYYVIGFFGELPAADAYASMRQAASRALALDQGLAGAHAALALHALHYEWDWQVADDRFREAIRISPNDAQVRHDYAHYLLAVGRVAESASESDRAVLLDPANMMLMACAGWHGFADHEYDHAIDQARAALSMTPGAFWPELILGWAHQQKGEHGPALTSLRSAVAGAPGSAFGLASLAHGLALAGERTPARALLRELFEAARQRYVSAYDIAAVHTGLGDVDEAFVWLRRAHAERSSMLINVAWDPRFAVLHGDARFRALIDAIGLPDRPAPRASAGAIRATPRM
jgi:adenylate cyclase